jgi:hypothetical protein
MSYAVLTRKGRKRHTLNSTSPESNKISKNDDEKNHILNSALLNVEEVKCGICYSAPTNTNLLQCSNGHLYCNPCIMKINKCSYCQEDFKQNKPGRNRVAEFVVSKIIDPCPNELCQIKMERGLIQDHLAEKCLFATFPCKYQCMGCDWNGFRGDDHVLTCSFKVTEIDKIRKRIEQVKRVSSEMDIKFNLLSCPLLDVFHKHLFKLIRNDSYTQLSQSFNASSYEMVGFELRYTNDAVEYRFPIPFKRLTSSRPLYATFLLSPQKPHSKIMPCQLNNILVSERIRTYFSNTYISLRLLPFSPLTQSEVSDLQCMPFELITSYHHESITNNCKVNPPWIDVSYS